MRSRPSLFSSRRPTSCASRCSPDCSRSPRTHRWPRRATATRSPGRLLPGSRSSGPTSRRSVPSRRRSPSSTPGSTPARADFGGRVVSQVTLTSLPRQLDRRRQWPRHVRRRARRGLGAGLRRRCPDRADRLDRRRGRQGHVDDERRDRGRRLDPRQQGRQEHPASPTSPSTLRSRARSPTTRWRRRSSGSGSPASSSSPPRATTPRTEPRAASAYAPANDPFVITVGAADIGSTMATSDDVAAPWSAHGYTLDGFAKPELGAPGRYLVAPVSAGAALARERPGSIVKPGYMRLSGTSFAAPLVAGAAAQLLALHPDLDAGSGQGRADGLRSKDERRSRARCRRARRFGGREHPGSAESERLASSLRRQRRL